MHGHADTMGLIGPYPSSYHHNSALDPDFSISPSPSPTDLHGFPCTTNSPCFPNFHSCTFDMPQADGPLDSRPADDPHAVYHLSEPKPRPHYHAFAQSQGGILDSPLVSSPVELPLSPPRTLPIGTRDLPGDDEPMFFGTPQFDVFQRSKPFGSELASTHHERLGTQDSSVDSEATPVFFGTPQFDSQRESYYGFQDKDHSDSEPNSAHSGPLSPTSYFAGLPHDSPDSFLFSDLMPLSPPETPSTGSSTDSEQDLPLETPPPIISDLPPFDDSFRCALDFRSLHDSDLLSSPCGRSLSDLPDFDDAPQSPSPSNYLLNLPGLPDGAVDQELFPLDLDVSSEVTDAITVREEKPLLFSDGYYARSPSMETLDWDFDPSVVEACTDPDLQNLLELRRKSEATVRSARQMEEEMLAAADYAGRMAVRRMRKRAKDRAKEITSMLRLKLYHSNPAEAPSPIMLGKEPVRSMEHLVARMMFRRKDICKPMSPRYESWEEGDSRHSSLGKYARGKSSLSQSTILQSD